MHPGALHCLFFRQSVSYLPLHKLLREFMGTETKTEEGRRLCLECGDVVPYGRTDKVYCSVKCKNRHYYAEHMAGRYIRTRINSILEKNYSLLEALIAGNIDSVLLSDLSVKGFSPDYMTSHRSRKYYSECGCYDIRYRQTSTRIYCIEKVWLVCFKRLWIFLYFCSLCRLYSDLL